MCNTYFKLRPEKWVWGSNYSFSFLRSKIASLSMFQEIVYRWYQASLWVTREISHGKHVHISTKGHQMLSNKMRLTCSTIGVRRHSSLCMGSDSLGGGGSKLSDETVACPVSLLKAGTCFLATKDHISTDIPLSLLLESCHWSCCWKRLYQRNRFDRVQFKSCIFWWMVETVQIRLTEQDLTPIITCLVEVWHPW